jgi:hypothetical protein
LLHRGVAAGVREIPFLLLYVCVLFDYAIGDAPQSLKSTQFSDFGEYGIGIWK